MLIGGILRGRYGKGMSLLDIGLKFLPRPPRVSQVTPCIDVYFRSSNKGLTVDSATSAKYTAMR